MGLVRSGLLNDSTELAEVQAIRCEATIFRSCRTNPIGSHEPHSWPHPRCVSAPAWPLLAPPIGQASNLAQDFRFFVFRQVERVKFGV